MGNDKQVYRWLDIAQSAKEVLRNSFPSEPTEAEVSEAVRLLNVLAGELQDAITKGAKDALL